MPIPPRQPLRLWPGVLAAIVLVLVRFLLPIAVPGAGPLAVPGAAACALVIVAWWLFFSRAGWLERIGAVGLMAVILVAVRPLLHFSVVGAGMGVLYFLLALPMLALALVASVAIARPDARRWLTMAAMMGLAALSFTLVRTGGVTGEGQSEFRWRWTPTAEDRLLAQAAGDSLPAPALPVVDSPGDSSSPAPDETEPEAGVLSPAPSTAPTGTPPPSWPGFRGPARDSAIASVRIDTDWHAAPPIEIWRRPIGPGWSSFAVDGDRLYTQEQRGEHEVVSCYLLSTGEPVWAHRDAARFYESNGGAGPRATPTLHGGRVYTLGATGIVNALDAGSGARFWTRDAQADTGATPPGWGFAGSPVVVDDLAIVAASGRLVAYDLTTGQPRWTRMTGGGGYSSPHVATVAGIRQVLLPSGGGVTSVAPADGAVLWEHPGTGVSIVQPAFAGGDILVAAGDMMGGTGIRRIAAAPNGAAWRIEERWASRGLKPYFNDFVVHEGHAYGFDGSILAAVNIADGSRAWKGGRYGNGQLLLFPDQDVLLVLSEHGELALVGATPDGYHEIARVAVLDGKTWNHPVVAGDLLLVRNGEEMAAFRLPASRR